MLLFVACLDLHVRVVYKLAPPHPHRRRRRRRMIPPSVRASTTSREAEAAAPALALSRSPLPRLLCCLASESDWLAKGRTGRQAHAAPGPIARGERPSIASSGTERDASERGKKGGGPCEEGIVEDMEQSVVDRNSRKYRKSTEGQSSRGRRATYSGKVGRRR